MSENAAKSRGIKAITVERLAQLNTGAPATNLTECLAVDFAALLQEAVPSIGADAIIAMKAAASEGISRRMPLAARLLRDHFGLSALETLAGHGSDTVRGWACFLVGIDDGVDLAARLAAIRRFADDPHFGVREWAWMAVRPHLVAELDRAIEILTGWTSDPSERVRRFACEALRPRGVWCAHIPALRKQPERAISLLEPLKSDPSVYVQDSVGNWLNDAGKDRPAWVQSLCARWADESPTPATARICRRALRSIKTG